MGDALAANGVGVSGGGLPVEQVYAPWQYVNDIYNISPDVATAQVLMAKGKTTYDRTWRGFTPSGGTQDDIRTVRDAMNWAQRLPPDQLSNYTSAMYAAGLYHASNYGKGANPPSGKVFDDQAQYAALNLYQQVVAYNAANPTAPKSMQEILQDRINNKVGQSLIDQNASQRQGSVYKITTDDPATLRSTVTSVGQALLGRALSDQEQSALVEKMLATERAPQQAAVNAGQTSDSGQDVTLASAQVDAKAQLEEQIRSKNPDEAAAYDQMNYYNVLSQMLKGQS